MSQDGKTQVSVKLPTSLYNSLVEAVATGKYTNQTVGIATALEHDLDDVLVTDMQQTIQSQADIIEEKDREIQKLVSNLSTIQAALDGHTNLIQEKDQRIADLQKQITIKDEQINKLNEAVEKQAVHIQSLIQENSRLNIKLLPENAHKKKWYEFWK